MHIKSWFEKFLWDDGENVCQITEINATTQYYKHSLLSLFSWKSIVKPILLFIIKDIALGDIHRWNVILKSSMNFSLKNDEVFKI